MSLTLGANFRHPLLYIKAIILSLRAGAFISDLVELKGAKITDFVVQFFIKELLVESNICSVNKS
jgi:hypothetical protein